MGMSATKSRGMSHSDSGHPVLTQSMWLCVCVCGMHHSPTCSTVTVCCVLSCCDSCANVVH